MLFFDIFFNNILLRWMLNNLIGEIFGVVIKYLCLNLFILVFVFFLYKKIFLLENLLNLFF